MQTANREEFMLFTEGTLLLYEHGAIPVVVNELECEAAMDALEKGKRIALTNNGKIISYIDLVEDCYVETIAEETK